MGEFLTGEGELILPVCSGNSALDRGATLTERWLHEPRAISNHPGVSPNCGAVSTREMCILVPKMFGLHMYERISDRGIGTYPPRLQRDLGVGPRGNTHRALAP